MTQAAAAGNTIAALDPTALLGDWRLTRRLADRRTGLSGVVRGQLTLRSEGGGHISWVEQGTLLWNGSRLAVSRSYRLLRAEDGWWLYFPDGRSFHAWTPGQWVHHPCREDSYRGLITITGPDRWRTLWEVDGPDKAQRIVTWLSRSAALGTAYEGRGGSGCPGSGCWLSCCAPLRVIIVARAARIAFRPEPRGTLSET
jgi:hypothetical protein